MYSKKYLEEKWDSAKHDIENILLADGDEDYVEFPEGRGIRENIKASFEAIANELGVELNV